MKDCPKPILGLQQHSLVAQLPAASLNSVLTNLCFLLIWLDKSFFLTNHNLKIQYSV
jgi:hypothetical protein